MLHILNRKLKRLYTKLRWPIRRRSKRNVVIKKFGKTNSKTHHQYSKEAPTGSAVIHPTSELSGSKSRRPIRLATFNAAFFSMAPVVPKSEKSPSLDFENEDFLKMNQGTSQNLRAKSMNDRPKSILKQSPLHPSSINTPDGVLSKQQKFAKSKLRVSINLPDNEISLKKSGQLSFVVDENDGSASSSNSRNNMKGKGPLRFSMSMSPSISHSFDGQSFRSTRTVLEVLRELNADVLALQDVKAEEEKAMKPLSDLAAALGMNYVFAESWAPEFGNAILSKWPIKRWKVQKIFDDTDFRNVLKATIDVPDIGEVNFYCTLVDHLDENWRMKQINTIIQSADTPHILAGGLNSLDETDYSAERWKDIVKYYEEMGKPTPKVQVVKHLKSKQYTDAKDFAGECESVVMIAKGQSVQGTCKYGTRVDYLLSSPNSPYKFVPGSYSVLSSKGTSDHHIVKVDMIKTQSIPQEFGDGKMGQPRQRVVKFKNTSPSTKGIWKSQT